MELTLKLSPIRNHEYVIFLAAGIIISGYVLQLYMMIYDLQQYWQSTIVTN
jgi:hypothetical protein